jgi:hypothetical protein
MYETEDRPLTPELAKDRTIENAQAAVNFALSKGERHIEIPVVVESVIVERFRKAGWNVTHRFENCIVYEKRLYNFSPRSEDPKTDNSPTISNTVTAIGVVHTSPVISQATYITPAQPQGLGEQLQGITKLLEALPGALRKVLSEVITEGLE